MIMKKNRMNKVLAVIGAVMMMATAAMTVTASAADAPAGTPAFTMVGGTVIDLGGQLVVVWPATPQPNGLSALPIPLRR